jgi:hypothetical protein
MDATETARDISFCNHTIQEAWPLVVPTRGPIRVSPASPLVLGAPHIRFYIGVPLRTRDGYNIGVLCSMDTKVRHLTDAQICKSELRASDYIGRLGGDEFTVMLPETPLATAFEVAERLRKVLEAIRASASPDVAAQNAIPIFFSST